MAKVEGRNSVIELLKGERKVNKLYVQKGLNGNRIKKILNLAKKKNINIDKVSKNQINKMASSHAHQGIIADAEKINLVSPEEIVEYAKTKDEPPFIVILDQIQDPQNFGSIIRSAYAAGAHGLIFQDRRAADITPVVLKASAGASEHLLLSKVSNINYTIDKLKDLGVWITGTDLNTDKSYDEVDYKGSTAVVIGNEGKGMRRLVRENCDFLVKIPIKGDLDSLNASVAAGVIFYEVLSQRR
ncbi:MAG: 23S rRNA (guanosine(2251)-2'-O)-methyltransferase RlmB [Bacillota bacterium]